MKNVRYADSIAAMLRDNAKKVYYEKHGVNDFVSEEPAQEVIEASRKESEACRKAMEDLKALRSNDELSSSMPFAQYVGISAANDVIDARVRVLSDRAEMADARGTILKDYYDRKRDPAAYYESGRNIYTSIETYANKYYDLTASKYAQADAEIFADAVDEEQMKQINAAMPETDSLYYNMFEEDLSAITLQEFYDREYEQADGTNYNDDQKRRQAAIQFKYNKDIYTDFQKRMMNATGWAVPNPFNADDYNNIRNSMETSTDPKQTDSYREALRDMCRENYKIQQNLGYNFDDEATADFAKDIANLVKEKPDKWKQPSVEDAVGGFDKASDTISPIAKTVVEYSRKLYQTSPTDTKWLDRAFDSMSSEKYECYKASDQYYLRDKDARYDVLDKQETLAIKRGSIIAGYEEAQNKLSDLNNQPTAWQVQDRGEWIVEQDIPDLNQTAEQYVDQLTLYIALQYAERSAQHTDTQPVFNSAYNEIYERVIPTDPDKTTEYLKAIEEASGRAMPGPNDYEEFLAKKDDIAALRALGDQKYRYEHQGIETISLPEKSAEEALLYEQIYKEIGRNPTDQISVTDPDYLNKLKNMQTSIDATKPAKVDKIEVGHAISSGKAGSETETICSNNISDDKGYSPYDD